jgi:hypothetical protein
LNGRSAFGALRGPTADGARRLELSATNQLRRGSNRLTATAVMYDGRTQTITQSFHLDRGRDIAGIRLLGPAQVGRRVRLDAALSRLVAGRLNASSVRWALIRKPAKSRIAIPSRGVRIAWTPDVPGDYIVRVTVASGARASSAVRTVSATYPYPLVPLNSIDSGTPSALAIGSDRYPVAGALQVNVLSRNNLESLGGKGFDATSDGISAMGSYLKALPDTDLVFVTHPSTSPPVSYSDLDALNTALGYIGGSYPGSWQLYMPGCWAGGADYCSQNSTGWYRLPGQPPIGSFSIAGVPGMTVGQAWRATAAQTHSTEGRITGYLSVGVPAETGGLSSYVITGGADQYVPVDTCASGGDSNECAIRVGNQTFAPTPGANGFNVVTLDRTTLAPIAHVTATSMSQLTNVLTHLATLPVGRQLNPEFIDDQRIVVIQSVGTGILPPSSANPYADLDQFGATPELFKAASTTGGGYAMVGVANNLPWHGTADESSPVASAGQNGTLRAILSRQRDSEYTPSAGGPDGQINLDLYTIMYQNPTPWPYADDPALAYIANNLKPLGGQNLNSDVRSSYTNTNIGWSDEADDLSRMTCTDVQQCGPNFDAVKAQLISEFQDVDIIENHFIPNLLKPLDDPQDVNVQAVYDQIKNTVNPPPAQDTNFGFLGMLVDVSNLASAVAFAAGQDQAGIALGLISAAGEYATDFTTTNDGDSSATITDTVNDLDEQLDAQQTAYKEELYDLQDILVSDVGKLETVADDAATNPDWAWDPAKNFAAAVNTLTASTVSQSYSALLPLTWSMFNLKPDNVTQTTSDDVNTYECGLDPKPFAPALPANQLHAVTSVTSQQAVESQVWTFANIDTKTFRAGDDFVTLPDGSLTDTLTSTVVDSGAFQYLPQWIRTTYNPPGWTVCLAETQGAHNPPAIPHADAAANQ